jgi:RNA polymerase sigma-70 factor (ECF subfamily)
MIQDVGEAVNKWQVLETASDEEVLHAARREPEYFRILVRRYEAPFLRKAKGILWSEEDAEEVVQDAFTRIYVYADRYAPQEGATFSSWAYAILTRLAFTRYKKLSQGRKRMAPLETETYERIPDTADFLEDLSIRNEVVVALAKLPETAARILRLQFIEGKSQEEIAAIEGSSVSAVKTRVHRAKKEFKKIYDSQKYE